MEEQLSFTSTKEVLVDTQDREELKREYAEVHDLIHCKDCANYIEYRGAFVCKAWFSSTVKEDGYCYKAIKRAK